LRNNGQEHRVGVAHGEIARFGVFKNLLLIEESRWVLLQDPVVVSLKLGPYVSQNGDRESLWPAVMHQPERR
jgi:hypothetical protein